ncbi:hypothetical protein VTH06DRAFT_1402 [Thermothelomyces fergusii]
MNREIPGFYYDSAKHRYFRIEKSQTAPARAEWSAQNVKRRAAEQAEEEERRARLRRDARRVTRARVAAVPLMGGLLAREAGMSPWGGGGGAGDEPVARAWAAGLAEKGEVRLWPSAGGTVSAMWVGCCGGGEDDGLGVVCAAADGLWPSSSFIPRDADDRINFQFAAERYPRLSFMPRALLGTLPFRGRVAAIKCHESSSRILLACEFHQGHVGIWHFPLRDPETGATSLLQQLLRGDIDGVEPRMSALVGGSAFAIHALQPAPPSSRLTCIAGTDRGIAQLHGDVLTLLAPPPRQNQQQQHPRRERRRRPQRPPDPDPDLAPWQGDVLAVDFPHPNPADTVLAGTRSGRVCLLDLRAPPREWSAGSGSAALRHPGSAAHVRSVGAHHVLVAGPRDAMALYDVRFLRQRQQQQQQQPQQRECGGAGAGWNDNATLPLFAFPAYRNAAHLRVGLDVLTEAGYGGSGSGIVAAAHAADGDGGGTVALYSLRDGARVAAAAVDGVRAPGVVQALQWRTLPGDRHPSLFVAEGLVVKKYSFWA